MRQRKELQMQLARIWLFERISITQTHLPVHLEHKIVRGGVEIACSPPQSFYPHECWRPREYQIFQAEVLPLVGWHIKDFDVHPISLQKKAEPQSSGRMLALDKVVKRKRARAWNARAIYLHMSTLCWHVRKERNGRRT